MDPTWTRVRGVRDWWPAEDAGVFTNESRKVDSAPARALTGLRHSEGRCELIARLIRVSLWSGGIVLDFFVLRFSRQGVELCARTGQNCPSCWCSYRRSSRTTSSRRAAPRRRSQTRSSSRTNWESRDDRGTDQATVGGWPGPRRLRRITVRDGLEAGRRISRLADRYLEPG